MPKPNTRDAMKRYRAGKAGFTDKAHLKAKGLIPRADGTKKKSPQYEDAPANATGTAVAGTGDDSSTVVVRRKKDKEKMKDRLLRRFKIKETIDRLVPAIEPPTDEVRERVDQLKELALGEAFTSQQIKQAYGILNDPRYKQGNYSGAVSAIEKLAKGLSKHPDVANALRRANEGFASDAQRRAAFASGYKAKGKKKKKEEVDLEEQKRELMLTYGKPGEKVKAYYTMFMQDLQNKASELRKKGFVVDKMGLKQPMSKLRDRIPEELDTDLEEGIKPYVSMQRDSKTNKMNYVVLDKDEKEVYRSSDERLATAYLRKNFNKLREDLEEAFSKKDFQKLEQSNDHTEAAKKLIDMFGTSDEKKEMNDIKARHEKTGYISGTDYSKRIKLVNRYYSRLK